VVSIISYAYSLFPAIFFEKNKHAMILREEETGKHKPSKQVAGIPLLNKKFMRLAEQVR